MDKELVDIVLHKSFVELTSNERKELIEWCSNEDEFDQLKNVFLEVELLKKQQTEDVKPETKRSLDALFAQKHQGKGSIIWNSAFVAAIYPKEKPIYKRPLFQVAAVCVLFFMAYPIISTNSELKDGISMAKNESSTTSESEKDTFNQAKVENTEKEKLSSDAKATNPNAKVKNIHFAEISNLDVENSSDFEGEKALAEEKSISIGSIGYNSIDIVDGDEQTFYSPAPATLSINGEKAGLASTLAKSDTKSEKLKIQPDGLYDDTDKDGIDYSKSVSDNSSVLDLLTVTF